MDITQRQMDIITAAIKIIANKGYEQLTTKNLAAEIGVTEAALYRHFASKRELVTMVLKYFEHISHQVIAEIKQAQCSPLECIKRFVMNRYELFSANPDLARVMFSEEVFKNDPTYIGMYQSIMHVHKEEVIGYLLKAKQAGTINPAHNPLQLFRIIIGSMRLLVSQWNMSNCGFNLLSEGEALLTTIINMIEVKQ